MTTETTKYEFSHGRRPRGRRYWFVTIRCADGSTVTSQGTGTPAQVRREAAANVRALGHRPVQCEVLP